MNRLPDGPTLMPALDTDLPNAERMVKMLRSFGPKVSGFKIGSLLVMQHGLPEICRRLQSEIPLILDMQKHGTDIPEIVRKQVEIAASAGVSAYIGSPLGAGSGTGGSKSGALEAFVSACHETGIVPIVVIEMSQPGASYFLRDDASEELAALVCQLGVQYVVAPANKPERLTQYRRIFLSQTKSVEIVSPGVGPQSTGDAARDAGAAVGAGADHIVAGRSLLNAVDPLKVFESMHAHICAARRARLEPS